MKKYLSLALILFAVAILTTGCSQNLSKSITANTLPPEIDKTTILVSDFEHQDPMMYDPFFINNSKPDSLKKLNTFTYPKDMQDNKEGLDRPVKMEHPLIMRTNAHLAEYNKKLAGIWKKYKYKYEIVSPGTVETNSRYTNKDIYRYVLKLKPILLCFSDPENNTTLSYRYVYYFFDRKENRPLEEIGVYLPNPVHTNQAIVYRLNHLYTN